MKSLRAAILFGAALAGAGIVGVEWLPTLAAQMSEEATDVYEVVPNWPQPNPDRSQSLSRVGGIFAESPNRIYMFTNGYVPTEWLNGKEEGQPTWPRRGPQSLGNCDEFGPAPSPGPSESCDGKGVHVKGSRWEHILVAVDASGKVVESWDHVNGMIYDPHGLNINPYDPERHLWLTDDYKEQIYKFTHDGKTLVMTLGTRMPGGIRAHQAGKHKTDDPAHLGGPNGIAFSPNGDIWVSDGYANYRVVHFSKDGKFLGQIGGTQGRLPGQFNTPHSVEVDSKGNVYVGDRGNFRVQFFDKDGQWKGGIEAVYPNALALSKDERFLYVGQGGANFRSEIRKYTVDGRFVQAWSRPRGVHPGELWSIHDFTIDSDGNLYVGQAYGSGAWKYRPKKGVSPNMLFGPLMKNSFRTPLSTR